MFSRVSLRAVFVAALLAVQASSVLAQRPAGDAASFAAYAGTGYRIAANITYLTASGMELKLDFYRPAQASGPLPTALFFHGGGYSINARKEGSALAVLPYLQMGWNAVNVEYRPSAVELAPAAITDARCAVRWVLNNAKDYNVDVNKIVVTGQSAGAQLALMAAMAPESAGFERSCPGAQPLKVAAVVSWFAITDFSPLVDNPAKAYAMTWIGPQPNRKEVAAMVSPVTHVRAGLPPIIHIHGDADPTVPYEQATRLVDGLKAAGVTAELVTIPGGGHGNFEQSQVLRAWTAIEAFLSKNGVTKGTATPPSSKE